MHAEVAKYFEILISSSTQAAKPDAETRIFNSLWEVQVTAEVSRFPFFCVLMDTIKTPMRRVAQGLTSPKFKQPKKVYTFFCGGGFAPADPPFKSAAVAASASQVRTLEPSRPLSRPPGVGSTWSMVWTVDYRTARSSSTRPADS